MNFSGFIKTSLINYPGKIASVVFTRGCNLRCAFCYNRDIVLDENSLIEEDAVLAHVAKRKEMVPAFVVSGGEPAIHTEITEFLYKVKAIGVSIKIDTNGLFPERIREWVTAGLVDYCAVDIKTSPSKYFRLTGVESDFSRIAETVGFLRQSGTAYELRTTAIPGYFDENDIAEIGAILGKVDSWYVQQYVNENTLDPRFENITPYSKESLTALCSAILPFSVHCEIRGL